MPAAREFRGGLAIPHREVERVAMDRKIRRDLVVPKRSIRYEVRYDIDALVRIVLRDLIDQVCAGPSMPNERQILGKGWRCANQHQRCESDAQQQASSRKGLTSHALPPILYRRFKNANRLSDSRQQVTLPRAC